MRSELVTNDYDAWVLINTIRLHFRNKRDVEGMLYKSFPVEKFNKAGERFFCQRMVKNYGTKRNIAIYVASNLVYNPNIWFHDLENEECRKRYFGARKILDAPLYTLADLMRRTTMKQLCEGDPIPRFISELMRGELAPELICIMDIAKPFLADVAKANKNIVVESMVSRLMKYKRFCSIRDEETRNQIIQLTSA